MKDQIDQLQKRIDLRPAVMPDDEPFLQSFYASTRDDLTGFVTEEGLLDQLMMMQYKGQKASFEVEFPAASHYIILLDKQPVGRLVLERRTDVIFGVDLAIVKEVRNLGVGTAVLLKILEECSRSELPFKFSVVKSNPAIRLYERLGCRIESDKGTHFSMVWR